jgi:hypothetical protein
MRIKFLNSGNTIYGIVVAMTSTTITYLHEIDPTDSQALHLMANSAITEPRWSSAKAPHGFPLALDKWSIIVRLTGNYTKSSPQSNVWYLIDASHVISVPVGSWELSYAGNFCYVCPSVGVSSGMQVTLSTTQNSEADQDFSAFDYQSQNIAGNTRFFFAARNKDVRLTGKTNYYLLLRDWYGGTVQLRVDGQSKGSLILKAKSAYL